MQIAVRISFPRSYNTDNGPGIPFRRGYLLHGVPGSGKSSLIHAIAGELMLDIYVVSLSSSWISDSTLTTLMGRVPSRCILLLEDLDAAFTRSVSRDKNSTGSPDGSTNGDEGDTAVQTVPSSSASKSRRNKDQISDINTLSLSGLLNALDGVAAAEGRILFAYVISTIRVLNLTVSLARRTISSAWILPFHVQVVWTSGLNLRMRRNGRLRLCSGTSSLALKSSLKTTK